MPGPGHRRTGRPVGRPSKASRPPTLLPQEPAPEIWEWDEDREKCLKMVFEGMHKTDIAAALKRHRSTIHLWTARKEFVTRLAQLRDEHVEVIRSRRVAQTSKFAD